MTDDSLISMHLYGSRTGTGSIDLDALLAFGDHFRRALRTIARERDGDEPVIAGHPTTADERASSLRLLGISEGSAVLEFEPSTDELFAPVEDSIRHLGRAVERGDVSESVHQSLTSAVRSLGDNGAFMVGSPRIREFRVDEQRLAEIRPDPTNSLDLRTHVDGWLHAVALVPDEIRVRDGEGTDWSCRFPPHLEDLIRGLVGEQVRVIGEVSAAERPRMNVTDVIALKDGLPAAVPQGLSADELIERSMRAAGVTAAQNVSDLRMDLDESDPSVVAFFEALESSS